MSNSARLIKFWVNATNGEQPMVLYVVSLHFCHGDFFSYLIRQWTRWMEKSWGERKLRLCWQSPQTRRGKSGRQLGRPPGILGERCRRAIGQEREHGCSVSALLSRYCISTSDTMMIFQPWISADVVAISALCRWYIDTNFRSLFCIVKCEKLHQVMLLSREHDGRQQ